MKPVAAEFMGTFWLVLGGCGSAVLAAAFPHVGIGLLGVSLAFGLTVLTMAFAIGHISGCHLNPAVTVGLWAGGRFPASGVLPYIVAQVLGGIAAAAVLYVIASGQAGFDLSAGFAPIAIGLCLTLIHLVSIPVTNTSVNPARSTGVALFVGDWAISQLWLFWVAPIVGAILGALAYRLVATEQK
ncbi:aquaporin [Aeromonas veronii]|uniref:aquaporin n=1 Tax=Aeromonas veronii TaxID=654 RepID=UPI0015EC99F5|nr:aquaporin [Aeromonas veronii]